VIADTATALGIYLFIAALFGLAAFVLWWDD